MANEILQKQKTSVSWLNTAGDETLTLTSLATVTGRKGDVHDWGAVHSSRVIVELTTDFAVSPASGAVVQVFWASSRNGTTFDGALAEGDAAASDTDVHRQLHWVGNLIADNTTAAQRQSWIFRLPGRYGFPVVYNATGQSFSSTAADHSLIITPYPDEVQ